MEHFRYCVICVHHDSMTRMNNLYTKITFYLHWHYVVLDSDDDIDSSEEGESESSDEDDNGDDHDEDEDLEGEEREDNEKEDGISYVNVVTCIWKVTLVTPHNVIIFHYCITIEVTLAINERLFYRVMLHKRLLLTDLILWRNYDKSVLKRVSIVVDEF